jgi:hypothetical protein
MCAQNSENTSRYLKILGTRMVTLVKFHREDSSIHVFSATIEKVVTMANWHHDSCAPCLLFFCYMELLVTCTIHHVYADYPADTLKTEIFK